MTKEKTPSNFDGVPPSRVILSGKLPRKHTNKFVYHVQGLDREGKIIRSRIYFREWSAIEYAENLLRFCDGVIPYIQKYELSPLISNPDWKTPNGVYLSRRDAEISLFGYSDIPAGGK